MTEKLFKLVAWLSLLILIALTVVPADERPVSGLQHELEHFVAFGSAGFFLGLAYAGRFRWLYPGAVAFALVLELCQIPLPSRHARVNDFIVDAIAACAGLAAVRLFRTSKRNLAHSSQSEKGNATL
jgi:VanZ family protein